MTDDEIVQQKSIEFYAASVNAWYTSALEHDKSIFVLAAGGIALLITLLTTIGFKEAITLTLFSVAVVSFLVTLGSLLWVFRLNQGYIEKTLSTGSLIADQKLQLLDRVTRWSFWIGVLFAAAVGFSAAFTSFEEKRNEKNFAMTNKSTPACNANSIQDSTGLNPGLTRSFHGAGSLQPAASTASSRPTASATPASAPTTASQATAQSSSAATNSKP